MIFYINIKKKSFATLKKTLKDEIDKIGEKGSNENSEFQDETVIYFIFFFFEKKNYIFD
mgnify:CR=1 FL=1